MRYIACFAFVIGCGGSDDTAPAKTDAAVDTAVADTAVVDTAVAETTPDAPPLPACGKEPYVVFGGLIREVGLAGAKPLAGASYSSTSCGAAPKYVSGAGGEWRVQVQKDLVGVTLFEAPGMISMLTGEWKASMDITANVDMFPEAFRGLLSEWKTGEAAVLLNVFSDGGIGACNAPEGVTIAVKDQPMAVVTYYNEASPPSAIAGATATSKSGVVTLTNVTGPFIELVGTKTGCKVTTVVGVNTGRIPVTAPHLSVHGVGIQNG
jgi:hypothetical protein